MAPLKSRAYSANVLEADSKFASNCNQRGPRSSHGSNFNYLGFCKFIRTILGSSRTKHPAFAKAVLYVVFLCSCKQVIRINT